MKPNKFVTGNRSIRMLNRCWPLPDRWRNYDRLKRAPSTQTQAVHKAIVRVRQQTLTGEEGKWLARVAAIQEQLLENRATIAATYRRPLDNETVFRESRIDELVRAGSISSQWGAFTFHLLRETRPKVSLELGTFFGVSALYQAAALECNNEGALFTVDQLEPLLELAQQNFADLPTTRVRIKQGMFLDVLDDILDYQQPFDFVLYDGSHEAEATRLTFDRFWPYVAHGGIVLLDDVDWSWGIRSVWRDIYQRPDVAAWIDIGRYGICIKGDHKTRHRYYLNPNILSGGVI